MLHLADAALYHGAKIVSVVDEGTFWANIGDFTKSRYIFKLWNIKGTEFNGES
jgi:hypothetical protein